MDDLILKLDLADCPRCRGAGYIEEESGWCVYAVCLDCGCRTAEIAFHDEAGRSDAVRKAADLWNMGKTVYTGPGD